MPERLLKLLDRLRHPQTGCPWDREQTPASLCAGILDEAFELVDAIENHGPLQVAEELGDLLFQLLFVVHIYARKEQFSLDEVIDGIAAKMIRRHPHVFGGETLTTSRQVINRWEQIKLGENRQGHPLDSVPLALPALAQTKRLWSRASRLGLVEDKPVRERELKDMLEQTLISGEARQLADFLFKLVIWASQRHLDGETLLRAANREFKNAVKEQGRE
ncbi:MAG: MazG family protein [Desulfarculales bacterium]|jgi:MazG family protein|nr:MazG family protein [Desulfarculales bacterium]